MKILVVIPTYKPTAPIFERVIDALKQQTLNPQEWRFLILENGIQSIESPEALVDWHPNGEYIFQEKAGLTEARLRAIQECREDMICFVDDDTALDPTYLEKGLDVLRQFPQIGAWGGQLIPVYDGYVPSDRAKNIWDDSFDKDAWANIPDRRCSPVGGGMFILRQVGEQYAAQIASDSRRLALGRKRGELTASEDIDMAYCATDLGLGIGKFLQLRLDHYIPESRCSDEYLDRLMEGFGYCGTILAHIRGLPFQNMSRIDFLVKSYKELRAKNKPSRDQVCRFKGMKKALREIRQM